MDILDMVFGLIFASVALVVGLYVINEISSFIEVGAWSRSTSNASFSLIVPFFIGGIRANNTPKEVRNKNVRLV